MTSRIGDTFLGLAVISTECIIDDVELPGIEYTLSDGRRVFETRDGSAVAIERTPGYQRYLKAAHAAGYRSLSLGD